MRPRFRSRLTLACLATCLSLSTPAAEQVQVSVAIEGLASASNPTTIDLAGALRTHVAAGLRAWTRWLDISAPRQIEVAVRIQPYPTGTGGGSSLTSSFVGAADGLNVYEQGVTAELRSGTDPNGADVDAVVIIDPAYLRDELWFDPDPVARTATVPATRTDAMSFFAHEMGHVLAFSGWKNQQTGKPADGYQSTFDRRRQFDGTDWWWTGTEANRLLGGAVVLSRMANTFDHYGNRDSEPVLVRGLMNGVEFTRGRRYQVGLLDLAMLKDTGTGLSAEIDLEPPVVAIHPGTRELTWTGTPLARYRIQSRTSWDGAWEIQQVVEYSGSTRGPATYRDPSFAGTVQRFYRLQLRP